MTFIDSVSLTTTQGLAVLALCAWLVWRGRPEWVLGIYLSTATWTRSVVIFGVVHTWVLLAAVLCAAAVFMVRTRLLLRLPRRDHWIILWLGAWTGWMLVLIALYRPDDTMPILRGWLLYTLIPLPFILLFGNDPRRIKGFAVAYLATMAVGGWFSLYVLDIPLGYLRSDPTLQSLGVVRLNIENYHFIGMGFSIALILATGLFVTSKSIYARLLILLASAWCAYFLVLSGSKQSIFFGLAAAALMVVWVAGRQGLRGWRILLAVVVPLILGVMLYQQAPSLVLRAKDTTLSEVAAASFAERRELWGEGMDVFWSSPLWGEGFSRAVVSHNLFVSTLADQGLVGLVFFVGVLVFVAGQIRGIGRSPISDDRTVWRMVFACLVIFCLLRGQVSAAVYSSWELFWAGAFLWLLRPSPVQAPLRRLGHEANGSASPTRQQGETVS